MAEPKDIAAAILAASVSLAGLLLVFAGFVYARGETLQPKRRDAFRIWAKLSCVPFLLAVICSLTSFESLLGSGPWYSYSIYIFRAVVGASGVYGVASVLIFL